MLVRAVIQRGKGNVKGILVVPDGDQRLLGEGLFDGTARSRRHQLVVDAQALEHQRNVALGRGVQRVEGGDAVRAAEHQRAIRQYAGGPVVKLVSADAIGLEIMDETAVGPVVAAQAVEGGDPNVALAVFLDGCNVGAGSSVDGPTVAVFTEDESVGVGAQPEITGAVFA